MKIYLFTTALLSIFITATAQATPVKTVTAAPAGTAVESSDYGFFFKPNIGVDYQYTSVNYQDITGTGTFLDGYNYGDGFSDSIHGVNFHAGARIHKNLGFEFGYLTTGSSDKDVNVLGTDVNTSVKVEGFNFDALGYLPVDNKGNFELIGTVGVSRLKATATANITGLTASSSSTETKGRIGAGAQYWLNDNINIRGLVRYQGADFDGIIDDAITANLGVNFQF